jgi:signal transduction histidine kinase/ActR/RegA family two-component response regulator
MEVNLALESLRVHENTTTVVGEANLLLLEALPVSVLILNQMEHVIWANGRASTLLNQSQRHLAGVRISQLLAPLLAPSGPAQPPVDGSVQKELVTLLTNGEVVCERMQTTLTDAEGTELGHLVALHPLAPGAHSITGKTGIESATLPVPKDAADQLEAIQRLVQERDLYLTLLKNARQMESLGLMTAGITHDLNNVLTAISGYAELCASDAELEDRTRKGIVRISEAARRGMELVAQVLHFARTEHTAVCRFPLHLAVEEALDLIMATKPSNVHILREFEQNDCDAICSRTQAHQIVLNIGRNAVQALGSTGGTVKVRVYRWTQDPTNNPELCLPAGQYSCLEIADNGPGIAPEDLPHVFTPLFRRREGNGSGIGLALVNAIVTALGGVITVQSTLGAGARFHVYFPQNPQQQDAPQAREVLTKHILLVDDEPNVVQVLKLMLVRSGFVVTVANSGTSALEHFLAAPSAIDMLITDLHMPGLRGDHLAREIHRERPDLPILYITGHVEELCLCAATGHDSQHVLMKPFNISELLQGIQHAATTHE